MSYLEMRGITKRFMNVTALDNVSFSAGKGEVHALAGENGGYGNRFKAQRKI